VQNLITPQLHVRISYSTFLFNENFGFRNVTSIAIWSPQPIHVLSSVLLGTLSISCCRVSSFTTVMLLSTVAYEL
jgi:hypothetical protein